MKINIREGFYRLFLLASLYPCFIGLLEALNYQRLRYVFFGVLCGFCIFVSYFVLEWILSGFFNFNFQSSGIRGIVFRVIEKLKKMNYLLLFIFSLFIIVVLSFAIYENLKVLSDKDEIIESLNNEIKSYQEIMEDSNRLNEQLSYINTIKESEREQQRNKEKNKQYNNRIKMFKNLPPMPQNHYYYIETPAYTYNRPATYESQNNDSSYNSYTNNRPYCDDTKIRLDQLEDKIQLMQWGIKTY